MTKQIIAEPKSTPLPRIPKTELKEWDHLFKLPEGSLIGASGAIFQRMKPTDREEHPRFVELTSLDRPGVEINEMDLLAVYIDHEILILRVGF